jgi:hypothetical protein
MDRYLRKKVGGGRRTGFKYGQMTRKEFLQRSLYPKLKNLYSAERLKPLENYLGKWANKEFSFTEKFKKQTSYNYRGHARLFGTIGLDLHSARRFGRYPIDIDTFMFRAKGAQIPHVNKVIKPIIKPKPKPKIIKQNITKVKTQSSKKIKSKTITPPMQSKFMKKSEPVINNYFVTTPKTKSFFNENKNLIFVAGAGAVFLLIFVLLLRWK